QLDLPRRERLDDRGVERHLVDAETGIDGGEFFLEQLCEMAGIARGTSGADRDLRSLAVAAIGGEDETARADARGFEMTAEILDEMPRRAGDVLGRPDRL